MKIFVNESGKNDPLEQHNFSAINMNILHVKVKIINSRIHKKYFHENFCK